MKNMMLCLLFVLCLAGCPEKPEDDYSIGRITIINIPMEIPVRFNTTVKNPTYKAYIFASDTTSIDDPYVTKGVVWLDSRDNAKNTARNGSVTKNEENNTYTVTMQLQKPNPGFNAEGQIVNSVSYWDPNLITENWSDTANFFTVILSPQDTVGHKVNAIWIKGGYTLNKGKSIMDWEKLINSRIPGPMDEAQINAIYGNSITDDQDIATEKI